MKPANTVIGTTSTGANVDILTVACPLCEAKVNEVCRNHQGKRVPYHGARVDLLIDENGNVRNESQPRLGGPRVNADRAAEMVWDDLSSGLITETRAQEMLRRIGDAEGRHPTILETEDISASA